MCTCRTIFVFGLLSMFISRSHAETVQYWVDVHNSWSEQTHPGLFPHEAHFSWFGGGVHDESVVFWEVGELASPGMVKMAETGVTTDLYQEVNEEVQRGNAHVAYDFMHWICPDAITHPSCGSSRLLIEATDDFSLVTLVSMLGPSPDWFVGTSGLSLRDETGWIQNMEVDLRPYDGGTRSANEWKLFGPKNNPPLPIAPITSESGQLVGPDSLGTMTFRLVARGDFNADGRIDAQDIDQLSAVIRNGDASTLYDVNSDAVIDEGDRTEWIQTIAKSLAGDANLDGAFTSTDFVQIFQAGKYDDGKPGNAGWADGDWNGDGDFDSSDFVLAFGEGQYERAVGADVVLEVPEPSPSWLLVGLVFSRRAIRRRIGFQPVALSNPTL